MTDQREPSPETSAFRLPTQPTQMEVTADMASDWLTSRNYPKNRPISKSVSGRYQRDMEQGRWLQTPQGYSFDTDGYLIDGQHRLKAQANSGVTLTMWVFPDQLRETFGVFDSGFKRAPSHMLSGTSHPALVAGALRFLVSASDQDRWSLPRWSAITTPEILVASRQWPEVTRYASAVRDVWRDTGIPTSAHLAVVAQAARTQAADKIPAWLESLRTGADLHSGDPRLTLRNRYFSLYRPIAQMPKRELDYRQITKSWNAYATDEPMSMMRVMTGESMVKVVGFDWGTENK